MNPATLSPTLKIFTALHCTELATKIFVVSAPEFEASITKKSFANGIDQYLMIVSLTDKNDVRLHCTIRLTFFCTGITVLSDCCSTVTNSPWL